ncbi:MAG: hypothetical protein ACHQF3_16100, partial [Alphaproteobacteria bacterium]
MSERPDQAGGAALPSGTAPRTPAVMVAAPSGSGRHLRRYLPVAATIGVGIISWIAAFVVVLRLEAGAMLADLDAHAK